MALPDAARDGFALLGEGDAVVVSHEDIAVFAQALHGKADRGLGHAKVRGDIHRARRAVLFTKHQYRFKIILSGFINLHTGNLLCVILSYSV